MISWQALRAGEWRRLRPNAAFGLVLAMAAISGVAALSPAFDPSSVLTADFWTVWAIAIGSLLMSGAVWAARPHEMATQLFAIGGAAFMTSLMAIAVYGAIGAHGHASMLGVLAHVNETANQVFYLSLMALFLAYPVRLVPAGWAWGLFGLLVPYLAVRATGLFGLQVVALGWPLLQLLVIVALTGWQWMATRRRPRERAALTWLALSVAVGASLWACVLLVSLVRGQHSDDGVILLVLFFPFYAGLAMGVARFCLVELQDWTFRILFFVIAAVLFLATDAALVTMAGAGQGTALGVTLLLVVFVYLPARDYIWRRIRDGRTMEPAALFDAVLKIAFAPTPLARAAKWRELLQTLFDPLQMDTAGRDVPDAVLEEDGLRLSLPAVADSPALTLGLARQGRGLFSPSQLALARQLVVLVRTAGDSRDAYERGASTARRQMAQDLHDDVGARLLSGLALADERVRPVFEGVLGDIRAISKAMLGQAAPLDQIVADMRYECVRRLEAAGLVAVWTPWPEDAGLVLASYRLQKTLASSLREAVSNIIRHAGATTATIDLAIVGDDLMCRVSDDGVGVPQAALDGEASGQGMSGLGLSGLARRAGEVGGSLRFEPVAAGTCLVISLPLKGGL